MFPSVVPRSSRNYRPEVMGQPWSKPGKTRNCDLGPVHSHSGRSTVDQFVAYVLIFKATSPKGKVALGRPELHRRYAGTCVICLDFHAGINCWLEHVISNNSFAILSYPYL